MCASYEAFPPSYALVSSRLEFCQYEAKFASMDSEYDPPAMESIEDCKKRRTLLRLCPKETLKALNSTGDTNQLLREIHVDMNNDLKKRLKEMKAQLKRSRRRKKPKKGKTKKKINRRRHQKKKKSQTKKQKMSSE